MNAPETEPGPEDDGDGGGGGRRSLVILIVVVLLVAGAVWMAQQLRSANRVQDCMMAGRTNCAPPQ